MSEAKPTRSPSSPTTPAHREHSRISVPRLLAGSIAMTAIAAGLLLGRRLAGPDAAELTRRAEADLQANRWRAAEDDIRGLAALRPLTPKDRFLQARIEIGAGQSEKALEILSGLVDEPDLGAQALYLAGLIERRRNRLRFAEAAYRQAIDRDPRLIGARRELIYILGMQSRRGELDTAFHEMARIVPLNQYDMYIWCLTHFVNWGTESAEDLKPFLEADPDDRETRLAMARLLLASPGQEGRVDELLRPLAAEDPAVLAFRAEQDLNRGRLAEALQRLESTKSEDPMLERLRARIALRRGDREAAVRHFRRALSEAPYDRVSTSELGKALILQGDRSSAQAYIDQSHRLDEVYNLVTRIGKPDEPVVSVADLKRMAHACEVAGLSAEARGWYQLAIDRDVFDQEAQQGLHRLREAEAPKG